MQCNCGAMTEPRTYKVSLLDNAHQWFPLLEPEHLPIKLELDVCKGEVVDKLCDYEFQNEVFRIIFPDDVAFVVKQVRYASGRERLEIVRRYIKEFDAGYRAEPNPIKKRNAGRYRANFSIREANFNLPTAEELCND